MTDHDGTGAPVDEEIVITPEMVEAGCRQFWSFDPRVEDTADVVKRIWTVITSARIVGKS